MMAPVTGEIIPRMRMKNHWCFPAGEGQSLVGAEKKGIPVGAGKVLYIGPHTLHNIVNSGTEPLVYIYCVAPIGQDEQKK